MLVQSEWVSPLNFKRQQQQWVKEGIDDAKLVSRLAEAFCRRRLFGEKGYMLNSNVKLDKKLKLDLRRCIDDEPKLKLDLKLNRRMRIVTMQRWKHNCGGAAEHQDVDRGSNDRLDKNSPFRGHQQTYSFVDFFDSQYQHGGCSLYKYVESVLILYTCANAAKYLPIRSSHPWATPYLVS